MIAYIIDIVFWYFRTGMGDFWFYPLIALLFIGSVPSIIRYIFMR